MALYKTLGSFEMESEELMASHEPRFTNGNKRRLFSKAMEKKFSSLDGEVRVTRCTPDTEEMDSATLTKTNVRIRQNPGFFDYKTDQNTEHRNVWWMNYADPKLFGYYQGDCFAQDEIQVLEHPILASVREYLIDPGEEHMVPKTMVKDGSEYVATPFLVENVSLWLTVNSCPKLPDGMPVNIYGSSFADADQEQIDAGCKIFDGSVKDNIMAVAAPNCGRGEYTYEDIELILKTLISAFCQAKDLSPDKECIIHGGNWGCGAFGGNRELMYFAQMYAASVCGINGIIFHSVDDDDAFDDAQWKYEHLDDQMSLDAVVMYLMDQEYEWGRSDGN